MVRRPDISAVTRHIYGILPVRESALITGFKMTKPESQKVGMETTPPVRAVARGARLMPTILRMESAIFCAPPVISSTSPMMTPQTITMPMFCIVPPNPDATMFASSESGMPAATPSISDTMSRERNACSLNFEISTKSKTTLRTRSKTEYID